MGSKDLLLSGDQVIIDNIIAQAYTMRAYAYFIANPIVPADLRSVTNNPQVFLCTPNLLQQQLKVRVEGPWRSLSTDQPVTLIMQLPSSQEIKTRQEHKSHG